MSVLAAAIIGGAAALASGIGSWVSAKKNRKAQQAYNTRQEEIAKENWDKQNQRDIDFWNMQNAYNDPLAQQQRLKTAGLNPNLVYGSGADATAGPIATHAAPKPDIRPVEHEGMPDIAPSIMTFLNIRQQAANIARTEAETSAVDAKTANQVFLNRLNTDDYLGELQRAVKLDNASKSLSNKAKSYENITMEELVGGQSNQYGDVFMHMGENLQAKARKADINRTFQELENSKKLGDIRGWEAQMKAFEYRLAQQGIYRGSGDWSMIINGLFYAMFGVPIHQAGGLLKNLGDKILNK